MKSWHHRGSIPIFRYPAFTFLVVIYIYTCITYDIYIYISLYILCLVWNHTFSNTPINSAVIRNFFDPLGGPSNSQRSSLGLIWIPWSGRTCFRWWVTKSGASGCWYPLESWFHRKFLMVYAHNHHFFLSVLIRKVVFFLICDLSFWKHPYMFKWGCHVLEKGGPCEKLTRNSRRSSVFYWVSVGCLFFCHLGYMRIQSRQTNTFLQGI